MAFYVGQKVVCVDTDNYTCGCYCPGNELIKGEVYTISGLGLLSTGEPGCNVAELTPPLNYPFRFRQSRFRPIVSRPTDISIFTAMLGPKETVDA